MEIKILSTEMASEILKDAFEPKADILKNVCEQLQTKGKRKVLDINGKYVLCDYSPTDHEVMLFTMKSNGKPEFSEFKNIDTVII